MDFRISNFCHFVESEDNSAVAIYNALTLGVVIADKATADKLKKLKYKIIQSDELSTISKNPDFMLDALVENKLLVGADSSIDSNDLNIIRSGLNCRRIGIAYLMLTDSCNLGCKYCFVENAIPNTYKFSSMDESTVNRSLDFFSGLVQKSHGVDEPQVIIYGGEPLMNIRAVETALKKVVGLKKQKLLPENTTITINTNGTLINDETVSFFKDVSGLNIAISIDGPREIHDSCRVYHNGRGSYDEIMRGLEILQKNNISAGFCCTINRHNVDHLEEIAKWFTDKMGAKSMGFNLLIGNQGIEDVMGNPAAYAEKASRKIIECFKYFRNKGVFEDRIMRKVNAFVDGKIYYHDCGGCGQQIVISPDGMVGVCQGYCGTRKNFFHQDDEFDPLNHPTWDEWRSRSPLNMHQCLECVALSVCGGGCPYSAELSHGSIWGLDDIFCAHAKSTVGFLIEDLINNMINKMK